MKVHELIEMLHTLPEEAEIVASLHEDDDDVSWYEITDVESSGDEEHRLMFLGERVMG